MRAASPLQSIVVFSSSAPQMLEAKFPVSRENTGNFLDSGLGNALTEAKKVIISVLYGPIPYASEQGIFCGLQGIKSGEQGNSRPDQGISRWSAIWRFAVVDLERCRESEQGRRQIFEVADADLGARGRLCPSESLLHARRRTRRRKRSAFRALHRAHPRRRAGVRIPFPPPAKGGPDSQTLPFARNTYFLRYCFYGTMTTRINFV
jgi:hypothetical protein